MAKKRFVNFLEFHAPLLESGKYDISLEQSMQIGTETVLSPAPLEKVLYVQGNRFALDSDQIHAVYPHEGSRGDYSAVLPHIVLNRSILPWERSVDGAIDSMRPWMALMVFDANEGDRAPIAKTISVEELYESSKGSDVVVPYFIADPPSDMADLLEPGEKSDDPVSILDIPKSLLTPILPKYSDLKYIAHVRRTVDFKGHYITFDTFFEKLSDISREDAETAWAILQQEGVVVDDQRTGGAHVFPKVFFPNDLEDAFTNAGLSLDLAAIKSTILGLRDEAFTGTSEDFDDKGEERAFLVANRMAMPNGKHEVHLVGLFNCYDENSESFRFDDASDDKPVRLITYKSWSFSSVDENLDFLGLSKNISVGNLGKDGQPSAGSASSKYLDAGFIALPHHLRTGKNTVSLYRGPLMPSTMADTSLVDNLPVETSDRLLRYDKQSGLLDASYATAWELGRKMGLSDKHFAQNLQLLKKQYNQKEKRQNQYPNISYLPVNGEDETSVAPLFCLHGHSAPVVAVCFSNDGSAVLSASADNTVKLWKADTGQLVFTFEGHTNTVNAVAYAPNGKWALSGSSDFTLNVWDVLTGKRMRSILHASAITALDINVDGRTIAVGLADHSALLYDTTTFLEVGQLKAKSGDFAEGHEGPITSIKFSQDGTRIITGSGDQTAKVWNLESQEVEFSLGGGGDEVVAIDEYENTVEGKKLIAVASRNGTIKIFDGQLGPELHTFNTPDGGVQGAVFSSDGLRIITASFNHKIETWDFETGLPLDTYEDGHNGPILAMQLSPSGQEIVTGSDDHSVVIWRNSSKKPYRTFFGHHTDAVTAIETSDDLSLILTASIDNTAKLWNSETFELIATLDGHTDTINAVVFSPNGEKIATAGNDNTAIIWDAKTFENLFELTGHGGKINCLGFTSDSRSLLTGSDDGTAMLWDADSGTSFLSLAQDSAVNCFAFSSDGALVATAGDGSKIKMWKTSTGVNLLDFTTDQTTINALDISSNQLQVLTAGADQTAKIWNISDGTLMATLAGEHTSELRAAIFANGNQRALTADDDGQVAVWNIAGQTMVHKTSPLDVTIKGFADGGRIIKYVGSNNSIVLDKAFAESGRFIKQQKGTNTSGLTKAGEGPEEVLVEWLDKFNDLQDIPFHYLVPKTDFIPEESLRFFQMDPYWIKCLKDGALSLGDTRKPNGQQNDLRSFWSDPVGQTTGFLLHSALVSGFPDLEIRGYTTAFNDTDLHPGGVSPRLSRKLSDNILLCLFDENLMIQTLDLFLPPGAVHFGFKEVKTGVNGDETISYLKDHKDLFGHESGGSFQLQDTIHWGENRVIDIEKMLTGGVADAALSLQNNLLTDANISAEGKEEFAGFTSADFALQMLEGSPLVRINLES